MVAQGRTARELDARGLNPCTSVSELQNIAKANLTRWVRNRAKIETGARDTRRRRLTRPGSVHQGTLLNLQMWTKKSWWSSTNCGTKRKELDPGG